MHHSERIAIVGMGGIFPGAPDLDRFWANVAGGVDSTREVPPGRWLLDVADAYDSRVGAADRVYSTRGGFVEGFQLDPEGLDLDPELIGRLDPMVHLLLHAGRAAWRSVVTDGINRARVGVIIGNIVLPTDGASAIARETLGRTLAERIGIEASEDDDAGSVDPLNAYVAGLPAGLLARALGLRGGSYTLDAACASSLYALKLAADELLSGRADAMLTGGLSRPDPLYTQMGFSQLRALSARGRPSPFDVQGDGLVVGEGAGMFVLKRLSDALARGDAIHGTIAAVGLSNDVDGGLLAPSSEGQLRAMRAAYERAGWDPRDVDLIECHATGTPVGDAVEFASLRALWGDDGWSPGRCAIGSVKSNIGHALTAAGSAGLLKVLLALRNGVLPPTANFTAPAPGLDYAASPFRVLNEPAAWPTHAGRPRRAAISGFGFGGINAHVLIEEWISESEANPQAGPLSPRERVGVRDSESPATSAGRRVAEAPGSAPSPYPSPGGRGDRLLASPSDAIHSSADTPRTVTAVAIVGMSAHFGPLRGLRAFQERVLGGDTERQPTPLENWWGAPDTRWFAHDTADRRDPQGYGIAELTLRPEQFRIPPKELEDMLPQQSLALQAAVDAAVDAGWGDGPRLKAGVFVGLGLDLNTTNFHVRWSLLPQARRWNQKLGLPDAPLDEWVATLRDAAGPALTANRTMGALGGLVASRIARQLRVGGPSFTVSSEETSGTRALDVALGLLDRGEIDEALVGAVDLACDLRAVLSSNQIHGQSSASAVPSDGAAAVVLKRLDDAVRDGDRIYAVIRGVGAAGGGDAQAYEEAAHRAYAASSVAPASVGYLEANGSGRPAEDRVETVALARLGGGWTDGPASCAIGSSKGAIGHSGAASGLASLVKAALALHQQMLPPLPDSEASRFCPAGGDSPFFAPRGPQFWLRDRARGPRRAAVSALGIDGNCLHVVLEAFEPAAAGTTADRLLPLGARRLALFALEADDAAGLDALSNELRDLAAREAGRPIEAVARTWWRRHPSDPSRPLGLAVVADSADSLRDRLTEARTGLGVRPPLGADAEVAFVFPGLGNQFAGMGRELSALWPEVLRAQDDETATLRSQLAPGTFWNTDPPETFADHREPILGQVALGEQVSDLLRSLGIEPNAVIGYSLGESAGLFALRAWTERDEMLGRIHESPLFRTELAGPCEAARREWGLADGEPAEWVAGVVPYPAESVRGALAGRQHAYLLIVNTQRECVVGGRREAVRDLVAALGGRFFPLPVVSTVHCAVARRVEPAYREMHRLKTTPPAGVRFYSGASGRGHAYVPDRESAADAIVAHAIDGIDFPAVVDRAYADGVRVFIEVGPGGSCTRMIGKILGARPHVAHAACLPGHDPLASVLTLLGRLIVERVPVDLASLYGPEAAAVGDFERAEPAGRVVRVEVGGRPFRVPPIPRRVGTTPEPLKRMVGDARPTMPQIALDADPLTRQLVATESSRAEAHEAFLRVSGDIGQTMSNQLAFQMALIEALMAEPAVAVIDDGPIPLEGPAPWLDRAGCLEFAVGSIGAVLGPEFAAIDAHPTRVRLPDEPLMLVDRIMAVEGRPRSLEGGRVVTEHDVLEGAWYLDGGRIPTCIAVESGQADLFLSGYLGIDFVTGGRAVYRLLDAVVTFHRGLPGPGAVIRYDIHIDHFFRQGQTHLFRFRFDATVDDEPLMTMSDGCAGFFTDAELAAGQGIVAPRVGRQTRPGGKPDDWRDLVPMGVESYDDRQVEALRHGDLAAAFGSLFAGLPLRDPARLPGGRMTLVHRVVELDPAGGRFGLGLIRAEADIHPDDWFMTCHFVDDRVMPGTLMYECCLHTLRVYLARMGWVGEHDDVACEPVPGVASRLKCRGQVIESTRKVTYEVSIKDLGYGPEPYAIVDALMYADGKPIVEITDMSLRMTGLSREALEAIWRDRPRPGAPASEPPALFDEDRILAFAIGRPSDAFGSPYRVFDADRVIARLPGPPFQFLSRITAIRAEPWKMVAGGEVEARYDVPENAWYFAAERRPRMPFAVLLEVALQPCGWLAAYIGSALTSDVDLKFRNLGGNAVQLAEVTPESGTLVTRVRITKVSHSAGMIIQNFEFDVRAGTTPVYRGDTYFGFFRAEALAEQVGLRDAALYAPGPDELARARRFAYPVANPFPDDRLRMIDQVDAYVPDGGPRGLGFIEGSQAVDPEAWYFRAHFHQDPVCPGSLGLESFLQLLKVVAVERWGVDPDDTPFATAAPDDPHRWTYRGQVVPDAGRVVVQASVTDVDDRRRRLKADGFLRVDGRTIFQMNGFTLGLDRPAGGAEAR